MLLGVDYEKAFNRMGHAECLKQLKLMGASDGSISLVRAFLEGRRMTISINGERAPKPTVEIRRGSPQGSVLGCLLATTQTLTSDLRPPPEDEDVVYFPQDTENDGAAEFWRNDSDHPAAFLYVDDTTLFKSVPMNRAVQHVTTDKTREELCNIPIGGDFIRLSERAGDRGMKINTTPKQLSF